jgi:hypothetical protein
MSKTASLPKKPDPRWKLYGAGVALIYAFYRVAIDPSTGDAIFGFVSALFLMAAEIPGLQVPDFIKPIRNIFDYGDRFARYLLIVIAVGGTALAAKEFFALRLLPDWMDFVVKRGGAALVPITVAVYLTMVVGKITFTLTNLEKNKSAYVWEFLFYVSTILFCVTFFLANMGFGFWDNLATGAAIRRETPLIWSNYMLKFWFCLATVFLVWSACFGLCLLSRYFEWQLRDRVSMQVGRS